MHCCSRSHTFGAFLGALFVCVATLGALVPNLAAQNWSARDTYLNKCSVCHAVDGSGQTLKGRKDHVKPIQQTIKKYSEAQMIKIVTDGKGVNMDSFKKEFSPNQIRALVEYYRSLAK